MFSSLVSDEVYHDDKYLMPILKSTTNINYNFAREKKSPVPRANNTAFDANISEIQQQR